MLLELNHGIQVLLPRNTHINQLHAGVSMLNWIWLNSPSSVNPSIWPPHLYELACLAQLWAVVNWMLNVKLTKQTNNTSQTEGWPIHKNNLDVVEYSSWMIFILQKSYNWKQYLRIITVTLHQKYGRATPTISAKIQWTPSTLKEVNRTWLLGITRKAAVSLSDINQHVVILDQRNNVIRAGLLKIDLVSSRSESRRTVMSEVPDLKLFLYLPRVVVGVSVTKTLHGNSPS